nr:actin-3-like [Ciona intestinalis]|eukprot:XP_002121890.1 actin-3-like [Ciona intestinalis]
MPGINISHTLPADEGLDDVFIEEQSHTEPSIILQCGSTTCKVGIAGEPSPLIHHCVVGEASDMRMFPPWYNSMSVLSAAFTDLRSSQLRFPFHRGVINNLEDAEKVWTSSLESVTRSQVDRSVLVTGSIINTQYGRRSVLTHLFENLDVASVCIAFEPLLSLLSRGRSTGLVVRCGGELTEAYPVISGVIQQHHCERTNLAGNDVTEYLRRILHFEKGYEWCRLGEQLIIEDVKETMAHVSLDYDAEMQLRPSHRTYQLNDGQTIPLGDELFRCSEILFQPELQGIRSKSVVDVIALAILNTNIEHRAELMNNIQLIGGGVKLRGFKDRLSAELDRITPQSITPNFVRDRENAAQITSWLGGSAYSEIFRHPSHWITKLEYEEEGYSSFTRRSNIEFI